MAGGESKAECDQRVARLWSRLGAEKKEHLDYNGLKKGLRRIDHRELLHDLIHPVLLMAPDSQ
jgi:solute carrier family 25 phosphate transporter 23/24/25/41